VFAALRVFAIFGRDKWLFAIVLLSGMVNPGLSIWAFVMSKPDLQQVLDYQWCTLDIKGNYQHYEIVMMVARAASVFSDGLVFVLTCSKTICGRIRVDINNTTQTSVSEALSIDTILCFGWEMTDVRNWLMMSHLHLERCVSSTSLGLLQVI